jgi:hypothetical protein
MSSQLFIHNIVHKIETARASRPFKYFLVLLTLVLLGVVYNYRVYRNFSTIEAMDCAQLARNLAEGKGYTTLFIRPLSMHLIQEVNQKNPRPLQPDEPPDYAQIKTAHPDIANAPLYPLVLAGWMKLLPFRYEVDLVSPFWSFVHPATGSRIFWRYQPDFLVAILNEILFLAVIAAAFVWARRIFDSKVAWVSAFILFSSELLWRFSVSGLPTMLLLLICTGLVWCLTLLESEIRDPKRRPWAVYALAAAAGVAAGLGGLTRYAFLWMIVPTLAWLLYIAGPRRLNLCLIALAAYALVAVPWLVRNHNLSGEFFGTAGYSVIETTGKFAEFRLQRSLDPLDAQIFPRLAWSKLFGNTRDILQHLLFNLGGGWITGFFLVGLMVPFRNPAIRRMSLFLVASIGLMIVVQALGRTQLSEDSPGINSENLLVLFLPLVVIYGVALFFVLLDQIHLPVRALRYPAIALFTALMCLPMIFVLLLPRTLPVVYPPYAPQAYSPPAIQQGARWMKETELMMSDVPWAVAWYGKRPCVWLTLYATQDPTGPESRESFYTINDFQKTISALYLTQRTLDTKFVSEWLQAGEHSWGKFLLKTLVRNETTTFPLRQAPRGFLPEQLFLSDVIRWESTR